MYRTNIAYTRSMLCRLHTDNNIGMIGHSHKVMVIHVHRHLANNKWPRKLEEFWDWLAGRLENCDVLKGDFNMALFMVIPELRSRGVTIDLAAWFPWKRTDGTPCADSCGIFFVKRPGLYQLKKGLADLHANDASGILWKEPDAAVAAGFDVFDGALANGPEFPLTNDLPPPKKKTLLCRR